MKADACSHQHLSIVLDLVVKGRGDVYSHQHLGTELDSVWGWHDPFFSSLFIFSVLYVSGNQLGPFTVND